MYIFAESSAVGRAYQYPLDLATLTLTGLISGSDVVVLQPSTSNEYDNTDSISGSTYSFIYDAGAISSVDIAIYKEGYVPEAVRNLPLTDAGASIPIAQTVDRAFQ